LVSIVTVSLNSEKHLEQTIQSVIGQTYDNIEYILIDGGSTDKTIEIIRKYEYFIEYWVSEPDDGIYDAMNKGISLARGEWVGIVNSDDWYNQKAVEWTVKASQKNPDVDIFHGDTMVVKSGGQYRRVTGSHENLLDQFRLRHPTCFVKRNIYRNHCFDPRFAVSADYDFILKLYYEKRTFAYLNLPVTYFRRIGISSNISFRCVLDRYIIRKTYDRKKAITLFIRDGLSYLDEVLYFCSTELEDALAKRRSPILLKSYKVLKRIIKFFWRDFS